MSANMGETSFWIKFFLDAGIPSQDATAYAIKFTDNRIQKTMLLDLNKVYLNDMGIVCLGDIIAILKHAKAYHDKVVRDKTLETIDGPPDGVKVAAVAAARRPVSPPPSSEGLSLISSVQHLAKERGRTAAAVVGVSTNATTAALSSVNAATRRSTSSVPQRPTAVERSHGSLAHTSAVKARVSEHHLSRQLPLMYVPDEGQEEEEEGLEVHLAKTRRAVLPPQKRTLSSKSLAAAALKVRSDKNATSSQLLSEDAWAGPALVGQGRSQREGASSIAQGGIFSRLGDSEEQVSVRPQAKVTVTGLAKAQSAFEQKPAGEARSITLKRPAAAAEEYYWTDEDDGELASHNKPPALPPVTPRHTTSGRMLGSEARYSLKRPKVVFDSGRGDSAVKAKEQRKVPTPSGHLHLGGDRKNSIGPAVAITTSRVSASSSSTSWRSKAVPSVKQRLGMHSGGDSSGSDGHGSAALILQRKSTLASLGGTGRPGTSERGRSNNSERSGVFSRLGV